MVITLKCLLVIPFMHIQLGSVVECFTGDRGAAGSNLTGVNVLYT